MEEEGEEDDQEGGSPFGSRRKIARGIISAKTFRHNTDAVSPQRQTTLSCLNSPFDGVNSHSLRLPNDTAAGNQASTFHFPWKQTEGYLREKKTNKDNDTNKERPMEQIREKVEVRQTNVLSIGQALSSSVQH